MYFVETMSISGLGNRSYLAGGTTSAVVVDPPRAIEWVIAAAARRGVRITHVVESHIHNDYVSGGLELARVTGATYLVPEGANVSFDRVIVADNDVVTVDANLTLRAIATPGHTPHHTSYILEDGGAPVAAFTGGSLLIGTVGRPDLVEPRLTEQLARAQHSSARRLAQLPEEVRVLPTHGFGSFCSAASCSSREDVTTIGMEKTRNHALVTDVDSFVAELLIGLDVIPAYYAHMAAANAAGPAPTDLTAPRRVNAKEISARLSAGEWVVDLRNRVSYAQGHVAGSFNFELEGQLATYLAWLVPWGKPITLLAETREQITAAQRELVQVGIDRPAAAATGDPAQWAGDAAALRSFPRAGFSALAKARKTAAAGTAEKIVVLDVRRASEQANGRIDGSVHIPLHQLHRRLDEVPAGTVWVHCVSGMRAAIAASMLDAAGRSVVAVDDSFQTACDIGIVIEPLSS